MMKDNVHKIVSLARNHSWRVIAGATLALCACVQHGGPAAVLDTVPRPVVAADSSRGWPSALLDVAPHAEVAADSQRGWPTRLLDVAPHAEIAADSQRGWPTRLLDTASLAPAARHVAAVSRVAGGPMQGSK